ncbi:hypothetical protein B0A52_10120 [Exophiala mesophila]|uniref:DUF7924 domain-containing protein n=1 Tax=Exophiala mesophila TaxID=212818 RepID=A0A438MSJ4_EXOME|nr:hypothetical protein B0A52_10120 [Exophiala mesophila]
MSVLPVEQKDSQPGEDLPQSSYDGSHLPWKAFRRDVLGPHRINIMETAPMQGLLPEPLLILIEKESVDSTRFNEQISAFRTQVEVGRGFGPSPLFPPNILPPIDNEPRLARCMVPAFSRDALPVRVSNDTCPLYELSVPRSGLGCGFSASAFTGDDLMHIPSWLNTSGTIVHFNTGYISPGAPLFCPFLVFERPISESQLEAANNQAAIGGSWCVRALQMLYNEAWKGEMLPEIPVSFSCTIDNAFAILNFHWLEEEKYCMAPLCKFDLNNDEHFTKFLIWIESIGKWALSHHLPMIKTALNRLKVKESTPPATPRPPKLSVATGMCPDELLINSLKTTFNNIPWRFEDDEFTPVSSSTASWGSPMVTDITFSNLQYPVLARGGPPHSAVSKRLQLPSLGQPTPPPAYAQSPELVWQKRFNHAMDEIRDLQGQIQTMKTEFDGSTMSLQTELCGVKTTMTSVLRKETLTLRNRSFSTGVTETWSAPQNAPRSPLANEVHPTLVLDRNAFPRSHIQAAKNGLSVQPAMLSPGLPSPQYCTTGPRSPGLPSPGMPSPGMPSPSFSIYSENNVVIVPPSPPLSSMWKFTTVMLSGHMLASMIPSTIARIFVLGVVTDICLLGFVSPHYPTSLAYLSSFWERT